MTVENISWSISRKECCRPRQHSFVEIDHEIFYIYNKRVIVLILVNTAPRWDIYRCSQACILWYPNLGQFTSISTISLITKTRLFKYIENFTPKNWEFSDKKLWYFSYFYSKHRLWVLFRTASAEAVLTGTHNLCFWSEIRKIMYTPINPNFTI